MIDLAEKMSSPEEAPCCEEPYYPTIHISKDEPISLPDKGQMVVKFEVISREESDRDGKKRYSCQVRLKKISQVKGPKPEKVDPYAQSSAILDALRDSIMEDDD
jgi:hypothetical protein